MKRILNILGITLAIILAGFVYYKNTHKAVKPNLAYDRYFHIGYTIARPVPGIVSLGPCNEVLSHFKVSGDTAYLQFQGKPVLMYKVLGADNENGLHLLAGDSTQITVYKVYSPRDPNNYDSSGLQLKFQKGEIVLFPTKKCF